MWLFGAELEQRGKGGGSVLIKGEVHSEKNLLTVFPLLSLVSPESPSMLFCGLLALDFGSLHAPPSLFWMLAGSWQRAHWD